MLPYAKATSICLEDGFEYDDFQFHILFFGFAKNSFHMELLIIIYVYLECEDNVVAKCGALVSHSRIQGFSYIPKRYVKS